MVVCCFYPSTPRGIQPRREIWGDTTNILLCRRYNFSLGGRIHNQDWISKYLGSWLIDAGISHTIVSPVFFVLLLQHWKRVRSSRMTKLVQNCRKVMVLAHDEVHSRDGICAPRCSCLQGLFGRCVSFCA